MKVRPGDIERQVARGDGRLRAVLLYGPDEGAVHELGVRLATLVAGDTSDPFRCVELASDALARDPARLADEASAQSLTGGRRAVRISGADEKLADLFQGFFDAPPPGDGLVVVEAGELEARGRLRRIFEAAPLGAAVACYAEEGRQLADTLRALLAESGASATEEAIGWLAAHAARDRALLRREMEKLALFAGATGAAGEGPGPSARITLADAQAVVGDSLGQDVDDVVMACASGAVEQFDRSLTRALGAGVDGDMLLRAALRHFQRLHLSHGHMASGLDPRGAMAKLQPRVFFKQEGAFEGQLRLWPLRRVEEALVRLLDAQATARRKGTPVDLLAARVLSGLAAAARGSRGGR
jgi:DNA polymerase-3 subunit delta